MAFDLTTIQGTVFGEFLLPFIFIFAVVYGTLLTSGTIKDKRSNLLIAFSISLFAALYGPLNEFLWRVMPAAAVILIVLFFINLVLKLVGIEKTGTTGGTKSLRWPMILVISLFILLATIGRDYIENIFPEGSNTLIFLVALFLILLIVNLSHEKAKQVEKANLQFFL